MVEFFKVQSRSQAVALLEAFAPVEEERVDLDGALGRVLSRPLVSPEALPPAPRSTMDGFAVRAKDTFGASESLPSLLQVVGEIHMGEAPRLCVRSGQAARIPTGGLLPEGADSVVMVEYTASIDEETLEVYKTVAPGENVVDRGEDVAEGERVLEPGWPLRPQDIGLMAALGVHRPWVRRKPVLAIISTGDEVVPVCSTPGPGGVRDINGPALSALVRAEGGVPRYMGIVGDQPELLKATCREALEGSDCLLLSGGSSVGVRDFGLEVLESLEGAAILAHGLAVKPGKPTLIARVGNKPLIGLPGHPVSALVIFHILVRPLIDRLSGRKHRREPRSIKARLTRNLASAQGLEEYVRISIEERDGELWAAPVLGASGLISTLVKAEGLLRIDAHQEGLLRGEWVEVNPFP